MLPVSRILLPIFFFLYWGVSACVLWWAYDISPLIRGGYYERHQALVLVTKMGFIVTVLTSVVWSFIMLRKKSSNARQAGWTAAWQTALVMAGYTAFVVGWRQFTGTPASDSAFVPILGSVNSHFFSEAGGLSFLLNVAPIMGCVSGILYFLRCRSIRS
jgi:hypothetical protein